MNNPQAQASILALVATVAVIGCTSSSSSSPVSLSPAPPSVTIVASPLEDPAQDVLLFRGDAARTGQMPGTTSATAPTLRWRFSADGPVRTAPLVKGGSVFVASDAGTLFAIGRTTGKAAWQRSLDGRPTSPVLAGDRLIIGVSTGHLTVVDANTGGSLWQRDMASAIVGAPDVVAEGVVIAASDGSVTLLDPADGRQRWTTTLKGHITRSPAIAAGLVIVPLDPGQVAALDLGNGRMRWLTKIADAGSVGTPATDGQVAFAASGLGAESSQRGVTGLDLATGAVRWRYRSPTGKTVYTPALAGGHAFVVGEDGIVVALEIETGSQLWTHRADEPIEALPAVAGDRLVIAGNHGHLRALDIDDGAEVWGVPIEGVPYAPAVAGGLVLVPSDTGTVSAFGAAE